MMLVLEARMAINQVLVSLLAGLIVGQLSIAIPHATVTVKNRVVANRTVDGPLLPWGSGKIASFGGLSAFLYRTESSGDWLYLYDDAGNGSHVVLPGPLDLNDRANAEYVLTSRSDLWIWSGVLGRAALRHYRLSSSGSRPLPDRATLVSIRNVGDSDTRPGGLLKLESGGLLGVWHQFRLHPDRRLDIGFIYVSPEGKIKTDYPISAPGSEGTPAAARWALAQHPADGGIWAFFKRDSYHQITAIHLTETAEGVRFDWMRPDFIGRNDGGHEPEGEYPHLAAIADASSDTLVLAYQNKRHEILYVTDGDGNFLNGSCGEGRFKRMDPYFFAKRAMMSIVRITADSRKTYQDFPELIERTQEFGLSVTDRLWILYRRIDCETSNYELLQRQGEVMLSYHDRGWNVPLILGQLGVEKDYYAASLFHSPYQPHFVMRLNDGLLHLFEAKPDP